MSSSPKLLPTAPCSILVRGVNWLGDAVMTTPALLRLRERFPDASITLVTPEKLSDLWLHHPAVDEVIPFKPGEGLLRVASRIRGWKFIRSAAQFEQGRLKGADRTLDNAMARSMQLLALVGDFASVPFDLALILPNSPRSALECRLARIPRRIGYARRWRSWTLTEAIPAPDEHTPMRKRSKKEIERLIAPSPLPSPPGARESAAASSGHPAPRHQIHEYLQLAAQLGASSEPIAPRLEVAADEVKAASALIAEELRSALPERACAIAPEFLALNPGAAYGPAKRWPADRFAAVARQVCEARPSAVWIAVGGPEDQKYCAEIVRLAGARMLNLAGNTGLRQLMALLKLARVLLTNDSGPMHVAAALGTPVVVPFGSTSFELTGPGSPGDKRHKLLSAAVPCSPCFLRECPIDFRCMTGIRVEQVVKSVLEVLRV